jgi:hypothetical protein
LTPRKSFATAFASFWTSNSSGILSPFFRPCARNADDDDDDDDDDEYRRGLLFNEEEEQQEQQEDERFLEDSANTRASVLCAREGETQHVLIVPMTTMMIL